MPDLGTDIQSTATASSAPAVGRSAMSVPDSMLVENQNAYQDVRRLSVFQFMEDTYTGDNGYRDGSYLIPHPKESFYEKRRARSVYYNVFQAIISSMSDSVFALDITRETENEYYEGFIENCDNCGTHLDDYLHHTTDMSRVMGLVFTVVDNYTNDEKNAVVADNLKDRVYPYVYMKSPYEINKYVIDKFGRLEMIEFFDHEEEDSNKNKTVYYRRWDSTETSLLHYNKDVEVIDSTVVHGLGVIPVVVHDAFLKIKSLKKLPDPPPFFGMAMLCFHLYNKESEVVVLEDNQCFSLLYTSGVDVNSMAIGPKNFIDCGADAKFPPGYASPDGAHLINLVANCDRVEEKIYKLAKQSGVIRIADAASGVAKEWDFRAEEIILKQTVTAATRVEEKIAEIFALYVRAQDIKLSITYQTNFSPTYDADRINTLIKELQEIPPEVITDEIWQEIVKITWRGDDIKIQEILDALEEAALKKETEKLNDETDPTAGDETKTPEELAAEAEQQAE